VNQPLVFALLGAGGLLLVSAVTGSSLADVISGRAGSVSHTGRTLAGGVAGVGSSVSAGVGSVLHSLFPSSTAVTPGRHDQGRDLQAPANTPVLAPGNGVLIRNGYDPTGFGDSYPIVHFTTGPWAGEDIYIGHTRSLLAPGETFTQGQPIAQTQNGRGPYVGNAAGLPGWLEIGLAPGGAPGPYGQNLPAGL